MNDEIGIFCENVKKLREKYKLSKKEMAKKIGVGVASLNMIESGKMPPRLSCDVVFKIYRHFGVKPADIFKNIDI